MVSSASHFSLNPSAGIGRKTTILTNSTSCLAGSHFLECRASDADAGEPNTVDCIDQDWVLMRIIRRDQGKIVIESEHVEPVMRQKSVAALGNKKTVAKIEEGGESTKTWADVACFRKAGDGVRAARAESPTYANVLASPRKSTATPPRNQNAPPAWNPKSSPRKATFPQ